MAKKSSNKGKAETQPLSVQKKALFYVITISVPFLFFVILEVVLRSINYLGNTELFIDPEIAGKELYIPNPNFAARYFFYTKTVPGPSGDAFLQEKPDNGFRVFTIGGSSAAGYPYGFNGTFSRVVADILQDAMPDRRVEVVNVGISAISSYTLFDQVGEIIEQKPDAVIMYAGHNEFYGALGVGSNETLGGFPGFVRFYLKLQRFKTFMLIRTIIVDSGKWVSNLFSEEKDPGGATLMERIIDSRSIELDSPKHKLAMHQFESNLEAIIAGFSEHGIPVYVASVASNLKDQPPFVNITDGDHPPAQKIFAEANSAFSDQRYEEAARQFTFAKDLDGLKFRAPGEINRIIRDATEDSELANYVAVEETLRANARQHIIGNDLMLEHLHPNQEGYFLIGRTFAEKLLEDFVPQATIKSSDLNSYKNKMYLAEFDNRIAWHRVQTLKQGFPFVQDGSNRLYQGNYKPAGLADSLAFNIVHRNSSWDRAKVELGKFYERTGQFEKALLEYQGLIRNQPWNDSPYLLAARIYLDRNDFAHAEPLLEKAYTIYPEDAFTTKMLGAIYVQKGNPEKAIRLLEQSRALNPDDPQMLYNLSGAYGTNKQYEKALEIADEVIEISPGFPGIQQWKQQLERITRN